MALGDHFSKEEKKSLKLPNGLQIGVVIRKHVNFTTPPKTKRFIIVGFYNNHYALVLINSEINSLFNYNEILKSQHIELECDNREYLIKDSFVDCSSLHHPFEIKVLEREIDEDPDIVIGTVDKNDLNLIIDTLKNSDIIKGKFKKRFGFYDY